MKKSGFTLIELLAVIAILAIILVISIPKILDVIETSKINALKNAVKLIADSAEKKYTENEAFGEENEITCDSVSKLNKEDYNKCTIIFDENGIAKVSIVGKGKFDGLAVINGTRISAKVIQLELPEYGEAKTFIENIYNDEVLRIANDLKKDNTEDENIRYYGSNPNNYVSFNNELWRIIGVFGNNVKLIRSEKIGNLSWDSSDSTINSGFGVNQWGESKDADGNNYVGANLQIYLNKRYYGGDTTIKCYSRFNMEKTCPTNILDDIAKTLIDNHIWNTGALNYNSIAKSFDTVEFYKAERGTLNGKMCSSGTYCDDIVTRTTEWTGYIGLPYVTDYAYASSESVCETNMKAQDSSNNYICKNNNWMYRSSTMWYLSPFAQPAYAHSVLLVLDNGNVNYGKASDLYSVYPSIYLKNNVIIESGNGTSSNPYKLQIES